MSKNVHWRTGYGLDSHNQGTRHVLVIETSWLGSACPNGSRRHRSRSGFERAWRQSMHLEAAAVTRTMLRYSVTSSRLTHVSLQLIKSFAAFMAAEAASFAVITTVIVQNRG